MTATRATREDVVREARSWVGTPYHNCADVKGSGVDCGMLLVRVFCDLGLAPAFDPRPYKPQWHLHSSEARYLGWIQRCAHRVHHPIAGDVVLFRLGKQAAHGGIMVGLNEMVHAYMEAGAVILDDPQRLPLHSAWSVF